MLEDYLTRRTFLLYTVASTPIFLFNSCANVPAKPESKSTPSLRLPRSLLQIPTDVITPARLGVNIHINEPLQNNVPMISQAGIGFVRIDFAWSNIEQQKGIYNFSVQENLVKVFAEHGIQTLATLAYSNPLYDKSEAPFHTGPHTDAVRQAFARFAAEAAAKFKEYGVVWEIWNEPNNPNFWKPVPNATDYTELARSTSKAIRQADTNANIIGPAVITFRPNLTVWGFLERCFELGLLEMVDAVSIHPYRDRLPETVIDDYQRLHTLTTRYAPPSKKNFPIVSSEWGYPVNTLVSRDLQAALLVRQFLINSVNGALLNVWYDWHDDGQDPKNLLDNFGIMAWNYKPKPAYSAVMTLMKELNGFRFIQRLSQASPEDFIFLFAQDNIQKLVVWTTKDTHSVRLRVTTTPVTIVKMTGERQSMAIPNGELVVELTGLPQYLLTGIKS